MVGPHNSEQLGSVQRDVWRGVLSVPTCCTCCVRGQYQSSDCPLTYGDMAAVAASFERLTSAEKSRVSQNRYLLAAALVAYKANRHEQAQTAATAADTARAGEKSGPVPGNFLDEKSTQSKNRSASSSELGDDASTDSIQG